MSEKSWRADEIEVLYRLKDTHTARQISELLPGRTTNSVIGKLYRLKYSGRRDEAKAERIKKPARRAPCTILELDTGQCRWPLGDMYASALLFCGKSASVPQPYCAAHCRMAYRSYAYV